MQSSGWVNSVDSIGEVISIGDNIGFRLSGDTTGFEIYSYFSFGDVNSWHPISAEVTVAMPQWHYVALVVDSDAGQIRLFIDGTLQSQADMVDELVYNKIGGNTLFGQGFREANTFEGLLDEVRVSSRVRSSAWVKLCWENQKTDQTLVDY